MDDFDALAAALAAGIADIRGCLILSRDGLVLGGYPGTAEAELKTAWVAFAALGEPERGFVQFGTEVWSYARRGPYASFAVTGIGVRPGLVIDQMEQLLLGAETARAGQEGLRNVGSAPTPSSGPVPSKSTKKKRTTLHREAALVAEPKVFHAEAPVEHPGFGAEEAPAPAPAAETTPPAPPPKRPPPAVPQEGSETPGEEDEIDRFSLAREFSQLLQDEPDDADG